MPTLILTPRMTEDSIALWKAAGRLKWDVERMTLFRPPDGFHVDGEAVLYVEALTAPLFAEALGLTLSEPPLDWLPRLPTEYRSRDVSLMTFGEARAITEPRFIKPPNDKSFRAAVYVGSELPAEYPDDVPVLVSDVVSWTMEFRCFILDRKIETFSIYLRNGELQRDGGFVHTDLEEVEMLQFATRVLADPRVELPRATVVDFGVIAGKGWAVVEQNAAWGSGIYACDPKKVLQVLRYSTTKGNAP